MGTGSDRTAIRRRQGAARPGRVADAPKRHAWITESVSEGWRCRIRRRRRSRPAPRDAGGDLVADGEVGLDAPDERETGRAAMGALGPRPSSRQIDTGLVLSRAARSEQELEPPQRVTLGRVEQRWSSPKARTRCMPFGGTCCRKRRNISSAGRVRTLWR